MRDGDGRGSFWGFVLFCMVAFSGIVWIFQWNGERRDEWYADRAAVLSMSGTELADELRVRGYDISGVLPGGTAEEYRIIVTALDSHGSCSMEYDAIVSCEWFKREGGR